EQVGLLAVEALQAEEVEMADRQLAVLVAARDREGRAGDRDLDAERAGGAADEGRLARAELSGDQDDVAGVQRLGQARGEGLRLGGRAGFSGDHEARAGAAAIRPPRAPRPAGRAGSGRSPCAAAPWGRRSSAPAPPAASSSAAAGSSAAAWSSGASSTAAASSSAAWAASSASRAAGSRSRRDRCTARRR